MHDLIHKLGRTRTQICCAPSNHAAYLVRSGKNRMNFHSKTHYGENHYQSSSYATTHAEMHAIYKVSKKHTENAKKRNKQTYNMVVIRVSSSTCQLGNSQVCKNCIDNIIISSKRTGIKIKKIYYSDHSGNMIKTTPLKLLQAEDPFISSYYNLCGYTSLYEKFKLKKDKYLHI